ncbi:MAG: LysR family transcriptional regulator [Acidimicrobiales bacterium]
MKLDVESLRALQLVVQTGGFTEAASHLGVTQSAVSWKIKRLEERVGVELVKRGGSEVVPTPDGRDLLFYVERIVQTHDEAVEHLSRSDLRGVVSLGANEDLRGGILADVLARFGRKYPNVRLDVRIQLSGQVRRWLEAGEIDLAVLQIPEEEVIDSDVVLWREELQWVTGRDHPLKPDRPSGSLGSSPVPVVSFGPGLSYLDAAERSLDRLGVDWRTVLESPMLAGVQAAVEAGLGIAALNERLQTPAMMRWDHGMFDGAGGEPTDDGLPGICEVIRVGGDDGSPILQALKASLEAALVDRQGPRRFRQRVAVAR